MNYLPGTPEVWINHGGFMSRLEPNMGLEVRFPNGSRMTQTHEQYVEIAARELDLFMESIGSHWVPCTCPLTVDFHLEACPMKVPTKKRSTTA